MLGHRKTRSVDVVAYQTSQVFAKTTPEASSGFTNVKKRASMAGYAVHKIFGLAGEMVTDSKGAFRASFLGMAPGTLTRTCSRLLRRGVFIGVHKHLKSRLYATKRWLWEGTSRLLIR